MNIAINAQLLSNQESYGGAGVSNYSRELLRALGQLAVRGATDYRLTAYVHAPQASMPGIEQQVSRLPLEHPGARIVWEQSALPVYLQRSKAMLVHGRVNILPLCAPCPGVVTVHDLSFVRTPEKLPPLKRVYQIALSRASVVRAAQGPTVQLEHMPAVLRDVAVAIDSGRPQGVVQGQCLTV